MQRTGNIIIGDGGSVDVTTDGSGDGTGAVTFKLPFGQIPKVLLTIQEADITGNAVATSVTAKGFTCTVDGSAVTTGTLTVVWMAFEVYS